MGRLTTHVLDTARGCPAASLSIDLYARDGTAQRLITSCTTNSDGRAAKPLLEGDTCLPGSYELVFHAGAYLQALGLDLPDPPFLDLIPVRFAIADASAHYHVPLLLSPFGYSTYRGS